MEPLLLRPPVHPRYQLAHALAEQFHGKERVYGNHPHSYHLDKVEEVLLRFGLNPDNVDHLELFVLARLHDTIEDTELRLEAIGEDFGVDMMTMVFRITNSPGMNRKERLVKTYEKIRLDYRVIVVKLADRIANMEQSLLDVREGRKNGKLRMYFDEYDGFRKALYRRNQRIEIWQQMWCHLDVLQVQAEQLLKK